MGHTKDINQYSFIVDAMLGKIARKLRIFGYDTVYDTNIDDMDILNSSKYYGRIVLTSDRLLFKRCKKKGMDAILMDKRTELENLVTIFRSLDIESVNSQKLPYLCTCCNGLLSTIMNKNLIKDQIPDRLFNSKNIFYRCNYCNKIYWIGSHMKRIDCLIREINKKLITAN
jgi:uncharacterized protein